MADQSKSSMRIRERKNMKGSRNRMKHSKETAAEVEGVNRKEMAP